MAIHKYRVRPGMSYGPTGQYKEGDIVELDDAAAKHEMDKLELAEIVHNVPQEPADETDLTGSEDAEGERTGEEAVARPKKSSSKKSGD